MKEKFDVYIGVNPVGWVSELPDGKWRAHSYITSGGKKPFPGRVAAEIWVRDEFYRVQEQEEP